jgi:hypothetical protein
MTYKIPFFTIILLITAFSSCQKTAIRLTQLNPEEIDSLQVMRPYAYLDLIGAAGIDGDTSTKVSIVMEDKIMDALEDVIPEKIAMQYFKPTKNEFSEIDSCLDLIKKKVFASGETSIYIPLPLREAMDREGIKYLLCVQAEGYQRTRKNYKNLKTVAIIGGTLGTILGSGWGTEIPLQGHAFLTAFIIDRRKNRIAFFKEIEIREKLIFEPNTVKKAVIQLFDGYFFKFKDGEFREIEKK